MDKLGEMIQALRPKKKPRVIELVAKAGFDVSDWSNFKGGPSKAGANPKYCYEWCFEQDGEFILNIWHDNLNMDDRGIFQKLNFRSRSMDTTSVRKMRAERFEEAVRKAHRKGTNLRIIILERDKAGGSGTKARMLDEEYWTVTQFDPSTGDFEIRRGLLRVEVDPDPPFSEEFVEGEWVRRFVNHRKRESRLRAAKISQHKLLNHGRVVCEVPRCGFEFSAVYGAKGQDYAQVHHLTPLSQVDEVGVVNTVDDLAVVCANCHAMIHRDGESRELDDLIPSINGDAGQCFPRS